MGLLGPAKDNFRVAPKYQGVFHTLGLNAQTIFTDPRIVVWRSIPERQNGYIDVDLGKGEVRRLHVKRFIPARGMTLPAQDELTGIRALETERIPTTPVVAFGTLLDRRSFIITEDLAGYRAADKAVAAGLPFETLLEPTADLAARLHARGLHHRDLYLCHFFEAPDGEPVDLRLIDAARVKRLPSILTRRRWIVKDLAQFWYSTLTLPVTDDQRAHWLARYGAERKLKSVTGLRRSIERKVQTIVRHDERLRGAQPTRNVSIPGG